MWDGKIVWVSRENYESRIHVMDYGIMGSPSNVEIDLGADGSYELAIPDDYVNPSWFNGSELIIPIQKEMASPGFRGIIPVKLSFNGVGRIVFSNLSIIYDLPIVIESSYFNDSIKSAICVFASSPIVANSSLNENTADIMIMSNSIPVFRNTSYSESRVVFNDYTGKLKLQNFLNLMASNISGMPINATVYVSTDSKTIHNKSIGKEGIAGGLIIYVALYFKK